MEITANHIKELREMTSCGVMDCKKALEEAGGDFEKAKEMLKQRGLELAAKKGNRSATDGRIETYIHAGAKLGVLVEINCETDFVANNEEFRQFSKDVAMQIAAGNPRYVRKEEIPEDVLSGQEDQDVFIKESCLLEQAFIKDTQMTIQEYQNSLIAKVGENIVINRFVRFKVNEV